MRSWRQAWQAVVDAAQPVGAERVSLWDARGRVLAEDVLADMDDPPFNRSAMDGFAVALPAAGATAAAGEYRLPVVGEAAAGAAPVDSALAPGTAVRVMTGAPTPVGTDGVVMVEHARLDAGHVSFARSAVGNHVRIQGEVARAGDVVVPAGARLTAERLGVLASVGAEFVSVHRAVRVRVHATGDELVGVGEHPGPGQIRDSNRWSVAAALSETGADVQLGAVIGDSMEAMGAALADIFEGGGEAPDVLVLTGGVSAGSYDFVSRALQEAGAEIDFHKVAMKPGKPLLFARVGSTLVFGLPGNPVSAVVTARIFAASAVRRAQGESSVELPLVAARLAQQMPAVGGRTTFVPARIVWQNNELWATPISTLGSADAVHHAAGQALLVREAGSPAAPTGSQVTAISFATPHNA